MTGRGSVAARLALVVLVCLSASFVEDRPQFGGALALRFEANIAVADPALISTHAERQLASLLFPRLIEFDAEGRRIPALLSGWEVSADGLTVRLRLSESDHGGVNGIISGDLAVSLLHVLRSAQHSPAELILRSISGSERFLDGRAPWLSGLMVPDDRTVEIRLDHRQPLLLDALSDVQVSPTRTVADESTTRTALGAFAPEPGRPGILNANLAFMNGKPYLDHIMTRRGAALQPGQQRGDLLPLDTNKSAEAGSPSVVYAGARCVYLVFHPAGTIQDVDQRAALLRTLDPETMARIFFGSSGGRLTSLVQASAVPVELTGEIVPPPASDAPRMRTVRIAHPADSAALKLVAGRIKVEMLVAGIEVRLIPYQGDVVPSCDAFLLDAMISDHAPEYSLWCALVRHARMLGDDSAPVSPQGDALVWLRELTQQFGESLDIVPLLQLRHSVAVDDRLRGVRFRFDGTLDFENAWIAPAGAQR